MFHHLVFPLKFKFSNELASSKIKVKIDEKVLPFLHKFKTWHRYQILIDRKIILKEVSIKLYTNEVTFLLSNIIIKLVIWSLQGENFSCILKVFCSLINFPIIDRLTILSCGWKIFAQHAEKIIIMFHKLIDYQKCKILCFRVWRTIVYQLQNYAR